jgi:hypothetical protein
MSKFEIYSLITSFLTAIGTCGATILALYFWVNAKKIKIRFRAMHANTYGSLLNIEGGYFVVTITNHSNWPITIETVGFKCYQRKFVTTRTLHQ